MSRPPYHIDSFYSYPRRYGQPQYSSQYQVPQWQPYHQEPVQQWQPTYPTYNQELVFQFSQGSHNMLAKGNQGIGL